MADTSRDISFEAAWGVNEKIDGSVLMTLDNIELEDEDEDEEGENSDEENALEERKRPRRGPFIWSLRANVNTTMEKYEHFRLGIQHRQISPLNVKTDIDIQVMH